MFDCRPLREAVLTQVGGGTPSRQIGAYWGGPIPWASVKDFVEGGSEILTTQETITERGLRASASNLIPSATPMVCTRMAVGRSAMAPMPVAINQDVKALFPARGTTGEYLLRLLAYIQPTAEANAVGSTVKGIRVQDYLSISVPIGPASDQPRIVAILDTLDPAIRQTEAIIEKLKLVKQGLLHDLLTRGIDDNGELRPPQSEAPHLYKKSALGWIPRQWQAEALGRVLVGGTRNGLYKPSAHHGRGPLMVQMGGMFRGDSVDFQSATRVGVTKSELNTFGLAVGDLLFARRSLTFEGAGQCAIVRQLPEPSTFESSIVRGRVDRMRLQPEFAVLFLRGALSSVHRRSLIRQVAVSGVSSDDIRHFIVGLPCIFEQQASIDSLLSAQSRIDTEALELHKRTLQKQGLS